MAFNKLSEKEIRKSKNEELLHLLLRVTHEIARDNLTELEKTELSEQKELIKKEILFRMDSSLLGGNLGFPNDLSPAERQFLEDADDIAAEFARMSDDQVQAYLEEHNLSHLVTPEAIDAMLADIKGDPIKAARLRLVWDRDEQKPKTED